MFQVPVNKTEYKINDIQCTHSEEIATAIWVIHYIPNLTLLPNATAIPLSNIKIFPAVTNQIQLI
jgi:hypothetical protein